MARVLVAAQLPAGAYPALPPGANSRDVTFQVCDSGLGNYTPIVENKTLILIQNVAVGAKTVTFTSVVDDKNRTGDITAYSVGASEIAMFGPFKAAGWSHGIGAGNGIWIDGEDANIKIAVITLP
jgi:hypothetical protein